MNGYGSEMDAGPPFFWEAVGHKHGLMLHRKIMWRDRYSATRCSPALQAVDSKQAENLSVGKTKSYWTNNSGGLLAEGNQRTCARSKKWRAEVRCSAPTASNGWEPLLAVWTRHQHADPHGRWRGARTWYQRRTSRFVVHDI